MSAMPSPPRALTLEAQRDQRLKVSNLTQRINSLFTWPENPEDATEQQLRVAISQSKDDKRTFLTNLLREYRRFKNAPGYRVGNCILQSCLFGAGLAESGVHGKVEKFSFDYDANFSNFMSALSQYLLLPCSDGLSLLALSFDATAGRADKFFTANQKIIATLRGRFQSLPLAPNNVIAFQIARTLHLPTPSLNAFGAEELRSQKISRLRPPSKKATSLEIFRGNLDPDQDKDNYIQLQWQRDAPKFSGDLDVYFWEQHKSLPVPPCAELRYFPRSDRDESNMIIIFRHEVSLWSFRSFRERLSFECSNVIYNDQVWSVPSEVFFSICALFQVIVSETTTFLEGASFELEEMNLLARQNPSTYKIRYLVHIEDCRSTAHQGVKHGLSVLHSIHGWISTQQKQTRFWDAGKSFEDRAAELKTDLDFICDELAKLEGEISVLKHTLYEHQALAHDRRDFILTLLAAVFLPLSFASTFFGMNMNTMTSPSPTGFSNWTATWIDESPAEMQNSTRALASTIGTSGTLTYNWTTYIVTAVCLVLTLPLSLTLGSILRTAYRNTAYYATYWRAFAIFPGLAFILFSIFGVLLPYGFIPYFICNGFLLLYLLFRLRWVWKSRQRVVFWQSLTILTGLCLGLDFLTGAFPMMVLPWLWFALAWVLPWLKRKKQAKARGQDATTIELEMTSMSTSNAQETTNMADSDEQRPS